MADGPVVGVMDGLPEQIAGQSPTGLPLDQYGGNHIVQDIGDGNYAFYAHLKTGSVKVKVGDQLTAGPGDRALGNTGNTDAPAPALSCDEHPGSAAVQRIAVRAQVVQARLDASPRMDGLDPLTQGKPAPMQPGFAAARRNRRQPTGSRRDDLCERRSTAGAVALSPTWSAWWCSARSAGAATPRA